MPLRPLRSDLLRLEARILPMQAGRDNTGLHGSFTSQHRSTSSGVNFTDRKGKAQSDGELPPALFNDLHSVGPPLLRVYQSKHLHQESMHH